MLNVARDTGFVADGSRLAWPSDNGVAHFTLSRADGAAFDAGMGGIERLYLLLDVPCSPADSRAFGRMVEVGASWPRACAPNWSMTRASRWPMAPKP